MESKYGALLCERRFLKLVAANVVNRFGDSIDAIAFSWLMFEVTGSASLMALMLGINMLPTIILQPLSGAVTDKLKKKTVMVVCDAGRGVLVALVAALYMTGLLTSFILIAAVVLNASLEAFRIPAGIAATPMLLPEEKYTVGSALNATVSRVMEIVGLALAGSAVALLGSAGALFIDAGTFFVSALIIGFIRFNEKLEKTRVTVKSTAKSFFEGFSYFKGNKLIITLGFVGMLLNFSLVPLSNLPTVYIADYIKAGPELLSVMQVAMVAGMGVGSFLTPKLTRFKNKMLIITTGFIGAVATAVVGLPYYTGDTTFMIVSIIVTAAVLGLTFGVTNVVYGAAFMKHVDGDFRARTGGIFNAMMVSAMPVGSVICAALAGVVSLPVLWLVFGLLSAAIYAALLFVKPLNDM